jgi:APA family basic amino acid/polyamine antiporter
MQEPQERGLKPTLGLVDATAIGGGAIVGAGIFVVTGIAAGPAGSALVVSMLIAGAISLLTALRFAELTAWRPREGSVYELAHESALPLCGLRDRLDVDGEQYLRRGRGRAGVRPLPQDSGASSLR